MSEPLNSESVTDGLLYDAGFLEDLRRQMLKFATLQLSDAHLAEDAVQDALVGALRNAQSFRATAALKTWVFAILKNKIADTLRQRERIVYAGSLLPVDDDTDEPGIPALFDRQGHWHRHERPRDWGDPEAAFHDTEFWRVFTICLDGLPARQARVLMMREYIELDSEEICASVGISHSNLHVTLHRARLRLRECLENHWFTERSEPC
jgi:RNA polymerase sigma-70 factor (TIGR02943 family)